MKTTEKRAEFAETSGPNKIPQQLLLSRRVRFTAALVPADALANDPAVDAVRNGLTRNSFAALPSMQGLGLHCEMTVTVRGEPDPITGYLMNISAIDRVVRDRARPIVEAVVQSRTDEPPSAILRRSLAAIQESLGDALESVRWNLSPYYGLTMSAAATNRVLITQSFEFAAAHRLHCDALDDDTNRTVFGKCNHPSGHGHNYRVEVSAEAALDADSRNAFTLQHLERIVDEMVIRRFDHKHLNIDLEEFKAVNPSVENITRVCFHLLQPPIEQAGATLRGVTVWETEKTSCTYPA